MGSIRPIISYSKNPKNHPSAKFNRLIKDSPDLFLSSARTLKGATRLFSTKFADPINEKTRLYGMTAEQKTSLAVASIRLCRVLGLSFDKLEHFSRATDMILDIRRKADATVIFGPGISVVNIAHADKKIFDVNEMVSFEFAAGVPLEYIKSFREGVRLKQEMLDAVKASRGPLTIFYQGHGEKQYLNIWSGITYQELGEALIFRGDIDQVNFLNFSCYSYNFIENLGKYLAENKYPAPKTMLSEANKDQKGHREYHVFSLFPDSLSFSDFFSSIRTLWSFKDKPTPVTVKDISNGETPDIYEREDPALFYAIDPKEFKGLIKKHFPFVEYKILPNMLEIF